MKEEDKEDTIYIPPSEQGGGDPFEVTLPLVNGTRLKFVGHEPSPRPRLLGESMELIGDPDLSWFHEPGRMDEIRKVYSEMFTQGLHAFLGDEAGMNPGKFIAPTLTLDDFKRQWMEMKEPLDWPKPHPFYGHLSVRGKDGLIPFESVTLPILDVHRAPTEAKTKPQKNKLGFLDGLGYQKRKR